MNQIEKALSDYLGEMCGMRLKPHALTGLAKAAIAAMPAQAELVAKLKGYLYEHPDNLPDFGTTPLTDADKAAGWTETPLYALPTPPAGGSDEQE